MFRVRRTTLEMLRDRGYAVMEDESDLLMRREEFEARYMETSGTEWLTMLRVRESDNEQIYVFFPEEVRGKAFPVKRLAEYIKRMERDNVHRGIFVLEGGLTHYAAKCIKQINAMGHYHLEMFQPNELIVNITQHYLVPKHEVLSTSEKRNLLARYRIRESQLPRIQRSDPIARYLGLTTGTVVKITRPSEVRTTVLTKPCTFF